MRLFAITVQLAGQKTRVTADSTATRITVESAGAVSAVADLGAASREAGRILGPQLEHARRLGAPWGLHVETQGYEAVYGEWPLLQVPEPPQRRRRPTPISEIRRRFRDGDPPVDALRNAIEIIEAVARLSRRAVA